MMKKPSRCAVLALAVASLYIPVWLYADYRRNVRTIEALEEVGKRWAEMLDEEVKLQKMLRR